MSSRYYSGQKSRVSTLLIGSLFCLSVFGFSFHKLCSTNFMGHSKRRQYLVHLRDLPQFSGNEVGISHFDKLIAERGAKIEDLFPGENVGEMGRWIVVTSEKPLYDVLINDDQDVEEVEFNQTVSLLPDLNEFSNESPQADRDKTWGLRLSKTKEGLAVLKPTRQVVVGVVDTGCDLNHPALKDRLVKGHNFAGGDEEDASNRNSEEMHATHVTGTIVAKLDSDGFYGIANSVAKVMNVRVLNENGSGTLISVSRGIVYAAEKGVNVINMSLGGPSYSRALHDAVKFAVNDKRVAVVCAKGNSNNDKAFYPAEFPEVIRVTATALKEDGTEERAYFSNYGTSSTCAAPGHIMYSTIPDGKYGYASGTSMACPHAAACAAVILSQGNFTPEEIKTIMETRGDELQTDKPVGKRINLYKFVQKAAHELMPLINNHPYSQCCIDAGIISSDLSYTEGNLDITVHQDNKGTWEMTCTPISNSQTVHEEVASVSAFVTVNDWCWKCGDFHTSNKVCAGVRTQPTPENAVAYLIH